MSRDSFHVSEHRDKQSALETPNLTYANLCAPSHKLLNRNKEEENRMNTNTKTNIIKKYSHVSVYDTPAFKRLFVLMKLLSNGNDEWCSNQLTLRNVCISVQEREETFYPDPVPICDVNCSHVRSSSSSYSDTNNFLFIEAPVSEDEELLGKQFVDNGCQCTNIPPFKKTEENLLFRRECEVTLRASGLRTNAVLRVLNNRRLQMKTIPGGSSLPAECKFKKRVYTHTVSNQMVCCFLSVKCSAYIQVIEDKCLIVGDDQAHDRDPKPCELFTLIKDGRDVDHVCHVDTVNDRKYLDYDRNTLNAFMSETKNAGFQTIHV